MLLLPELAPLPTERPLTIISSLNVETPTTLTLSKFVCPSTSISPPTSKLPNVPTPTADTPAPT